MDGVHTREAINSGSDGALVGKESRYTSLVLGAGSSDEGGVVNETVLYKARLSTTAQENSETT